MKKWKAHHHLRLLIHFHFWSLHRLTLVRKRNKKIGFSTNAKWTKTQKLVRFILVLFVISVSSTHFIRLQSNVSVKIFKGFFGVYDGHGSFETAEWCAKNVHKIFDDAITSYSQQNNGKRFDSSSVTEVPYFIFLLNSE